MIVRRFTSALPISRIVSTVSDSLAWYRNPRLARDASPPFTSDPGRSPTRPANVPAASRAVSRALAVATHPVL